jgi:Cupin-like domain
MLNTATLASSVLDIIAARVGRVGTAEPIQFVLSDLEEEDWCIQRDEAGCVVRRGRCETPALSIETDTRTLAALVSNTLGMSTPPCLSNMCLRGSVTLLTRLLFDENTWIDFSRERYAEAERTASQLVIDAVEKRPHASLDELIDHGRQSIPLVVTHAVEMPPARELTIPVLAERFADVVLTSEHAPPISVRTHLDRLSSVTTPTYYGHVLPTDMFNALAWPESWRATSLRAPLMFSATTAWLSAAHRHPNEVLNVQMAGRKLWNLYSPDQTPLLYVRPPTASHQMCQIETNATDLTMFPLFRLARPISVTLQPGDALLLPTGWYHEVIALEPSVSCAFILDRLQP